MKQCVICKAVLDGGASENGVFTCWRCLDGEPPPACDCSQHDAKWLNDTQEWQCVRCHKKRPRHEHYKERKDGMIVCQVCDKEMSEEGAMPEDGITYLCHEHYKERKDGMNIFKCAVCREESWFVDGADAHCIKCATPKITINPGKDTPDPVVFTRFCRGCGATTIDQKPIAACVACGRDYLYRKSEPDRLSPLPDNSHYTKLKMQPWDYIIANELNFFEGNVVKYVTRWKHKNGLDDLRKARVYIDELIRQEEAKATSPSPPE